MKKFLLFVIMILGCLNATAQEKNDSLVSVTKTSFVGINSLWELGLYYDNQSGILEFVPDGLAINNPTQQEVMWSSALPILARIPLEEGHNYVLRLTLKIPSDGTYWLDMCSWSVGYSYSRQVPVTASDDFQIIDVEYPEYGRSITDGMVFFGFGWVVGTTILKEIEVLEKRNTTDIQSIKVAKSTNNTIYNLAGQKVNTSYKGIVIRNGKKVVTKLDK